MKQEDSMFTRAWKLAYPLLTYYGISIFVAILAGILGVTYSIISLVQGGVTLDYYVLLEETLKWLALHGTQITLATSALVLVPTVLYWRSDQKQREGRSVVYAEPDAAGYVLAFALGAVACLAMNGLIMMSGLMEVSGTAMDEISEALYKGNLWLEILGIGLVSPVTEEFLFRGVIQGRLRDWVRPGAAILGAAAVFAFYHGYMLQMVYAFAMGLLFGYLMEKFHTLTAPILAHIGANLISVIVSETTMLDGILEGEMSLIIFTAAACLALVGLLSVVHHQVNLQLLPGPEEKESEEL